MALDTTFMDLNDSHAANFNGGFFPGENGFNDTAIGEGWTVIFAITGLTGQVVSTGLNPSDVSL
jgi:hypothetical protein